MDTDHSVVTAGVEGWEEVEEGIREINGDGKNKKYKLKEFFSSTNKMEKKNSNFSWRFNSYTSGCYRNLLINNE